MMYLRNERSMEARRTTADVVAVLNKVLKRCFPEAVEYATVIGQKRSSLPRVPQAGLEEMYARYSRFFEAEPAAVRRVHDAGPTPWWQLPGKAWRILCHQGLVPLLAEVSSYRRWKRMHGR
jgi:hypothetical protein